MGQGEDAAQDSGQAQDQREQGKDQKKEQEEERGIPGGAQQEQQRQQQGGPIGDSSVQHGTASLDGRGLDPLEDGFYGAAALSGLSPGREQETVGNRVRKDQAHIVGGHIVPAPDKGGGPAHGGNRQGGPGLAPWTMSGCSRVAPMSRTMYSHTASLR